MNKLFLVLLLLVTGCLGGGADKGEPKPPAEAAGKISLTLSPEDVVLMQGSDVTYDFTLKFEGQAPPSVKVRAAAGEIGVKVTPAEIKVVNGQAKGKITFASPPSYIVGDQKAEFKVTDPEGKTLADLQIGFYVLPPGAS